MSAAPEAVKEELAALYARADLSCPFGPAFFMTQLSRFVRDRCPEPTEQLPIVELRLADGEVLDVCHVIGVAPHWVALAARDRNRAGAMTTELVPYELIRRVLIRPRHGEAAGIGFETCHVPELVNPAALLRATMTRNLEEPPCEP